jgi:putative N6-adenine-specific DNA methylase
LTDRLACFAVTPPGVEGITARELAGSGITPDAPTPGGVGFGALHEELYAANLMLRTANRVLVRLAEFPARAFYELERKAKRVPWGLVLRPGDPVTFRVTSRKSKLYHLDGIAERLASSCGGSLGPESTDYTDDTDDSGEPVRSPATDRAPQLIVVRVFRDLVTISADSSGDLLHRRGYRQALGKAPLRETLAAALLLTAGYDGSGPLVDPFCGSGTIPIEGALIARRIPPGIHRRFAFEHWPSFEPALWESVRAAGREGMRDRAPAPILGWDRDAGAVAAAHSNAARAGVGADVALAQGAISRLVVPPGPGMIATNPPYGVRLGEAGDLRDLYARLGSVLRAECPGWRAVLLSADRAHDAATGLGLVEQWRSSNGGVKVRCSVADIPRS